MSGMNPNIHPNSGASAGPGTTTNANAVPLLAIDPTLTQIQPQVTGNLSAPDAHVLGATSQHGLPHNNNLGVQLPQMFPVIVAAQMTQHVEQRGLAQASAQGPGQPGVHRRWGWFGNERGRESRICGAG